MKKITENDNQYDSIVMSHRRHLHNIPEIGFDLPQTTKYILDTLSRMGYAPKIIGNGSIITSITGATDEFILLRADMDALPMQEETNLPFKSINGCMHACGHDMHISMLLTAAEVIRSIPRNKGVVFLFQAAEEILKGANDAIESKELEDYNICCAITVHVLPGLDFLPGTLVIPPSGFVAPGSDVLSIALIGKSSHGSTPHTGINSIYPALDIIETTNRMLMTEFAPSDLKFINWGLISGGREANIIPEKTSIKGNFRYFDQRVEEKALMRIKEIADSVSALNHCRCDFVIDGRCPPLHNNATLLEKIKVILLNNNFNYITADELKKEKKSSELGGSEDFAHFSNRYPSALISICAGSKSTGHAHTLHHPKTDFHENALLSGWRFFTAIAKEI